MHHRKTQIDNGEIFYAHEALKENEQILYFWKEHVPSVVFYSQQWKIPHKDPQLLLRRPTWSLRGLFLTSNRMNYEV